MVKGSGRDEFLAVLPDYSTAGANVPESHATTKSWCAQIGHESWMPI